MRDYYFVKKGASAVKDRSVNCSKRKGNQPMRYTILPSCKVVSTLSFPQNFLGKFYRFLDRQTPSFFVSPCQHRGSPSSATPKPPRKSSTSAIYPGSASRRSSSSSVSHSVRSSTPSATLVPIATRLLSNL